MDTGEAKNEFLNRLSESLSRNTFVRLVLSRPATAQAGLRRVVARWVNLKGQAHLSLTTRYQSRDVTKNVPLAEAVSWAEEQLPQFGNALLCTTTRDWQWSAPGPGRPRLISHRPSVRSLPDRDHDQPSERILDESAHDWLKALGITSENGSVRGSMADKYRQINRYLEILSHLAHDCGWESSSNLTLVDMGCGKGYLTFGAWHWLRRVRQLNARVLGVESRQDLVTKTNQIARAIDAEGLEFIEGRIESVPLPSLDGLIALHACDTATDDAILRGIRGQARLILVAPCCHREIRPQLGDPEPLAPVLRHGLMEERMAEWATDGLRGLFLEWAGYRTKIFEFISTEHTSKNLMISAVRQGEPFASAAARKRIEQLKAFFGLQRHALDVLLE